MLKSVVPCTFHARATCKKARSTRNDIHDALDLFHASIFPPIFLSYAPKYMGLIYQIASSWAHQVAIGILSRSHACVCIFQAKKLRSYACELFCPLEQIALTRACATVSICTALACVRACIMHWQEHCARTRACANVSTRTALALVRGG